MTMTGSAAADLFLQGLESLGGGTGLRDAIARIPAAIDSGMSIDQARQTVGGSNANEMIRQFAMNTRQRQEQAERDRNYALKVQNFAAKNTKGVETPELAAMRMNAADTLARLYNSAGSYNFGASGLGAAKNRIQRFFDKDFDAVQGGFEADKAQASAVLTNIVAAANKGQGPVTDADAKRFEIAASRIESAKTAEQLKAAIREVFSILDKEGRYILPA